MRHMILGLLFLLSLPGCRSSLSASSDDARKFIDNVNETRLLLGLQNNQARWVSENFITDDTQKIAARANLSYIDAMARFAKEATKFDKVEVSAGIRRELDLLKLSLTMVTPSDPREGEELTNLAASLKATYGKGKWCAAAASCLDIDKITNTMAESFDEKRLRQVWEGWQTISPPMRQDFTRFVELSNKGAKEMGFADTGEMWRSKYEMSPAEFTKEVDRLWDQVRPLYVSLHAFVRMKLHEKYGDVVPAAGPIPAHLLGDIWAQNWANLYPILQPPNADTGFDLTKILRDRNIMPKEMVKMGERFYTSLGFAPLPQSFWDRSLFVKPRDRDVVCHASAWDIDYVNDLRIKMCIEARADDFRTVHHELGHDFYFRAYNTQPAMFRDGANDGFHEAIGDTIALSITPEYLVKIGLLDKAPVSSRDIGLLLAQALDKVAFLPFGLLIDEWRWKVFSGEIAPADYNKAWWALRLKYQGIAPISPRGEEFFDPGAKFHVPANTPYTRYFLADILEFQFHRALSKSAGCTTPLHRCSIYESKEAGSRLNAMLSLGDSRPWPEALEAMTGSKQMDATAIMDYFAPLKTWLDEQIKGKPVDW